MATKRQMKTRTRAPPSRAKLLIPKVRTFSLLDAASTSQLVKYLEEEEALHPRLSPRAAQAHCTRRC